MERDAVVFRSLMFAAGAAVALALFVAPAYASGRADLESGRPAAHLQAQADPSASSLDWPSPRTIAARRGRA